MLTKQNAINIGSYYCSPFEGNSGESGVAKCLERGGEAQYEVLFGTDGKYDRLYFPERVSEAFWEY